jgi:hypothetical protein
MGGGPVTIGGGPVDSHIAWGILETGGRAFAGEYRVLESGVVIPRGAVLFAVDSQGLRYVLFPIGAAVRVEEDRRSAGVQLQSRTLSDRGSDHEFAALVCLKPRLIGVYTALVDEVLAKLGARPERPDLVCHQALEEWRELLEREMGKGLSFEARVGLFGELLTLRHLVRLNRAALATWVGPEGARHDFMATDISLETKTSASRRGRFVEIHGIEQLEPFPDSNLYMAFVRVERVPAGGETIDDVISNIVTLGADRAELLKRLARVGYVAGEMEEQAKDNFRLTEETYYAVEGEFPRITAASFPRNRVPPGVTRLTYEIDISSDPPRPLDSTEVKTILSRLASLRSSQP